MGKKNIFFGSFKTAMLLTLRLSAGVFGIVNKEKEKYTMDQSLLEM